MENSAAAKDDSHGLSDALYPGQDKHIQLEEQDDGAHIHSVFQQNQKRAPSLLRPEQVDKVQDDCFQPDLFLETPVLSMWQCLDQSPQSKVKLHRAIASPWDFTTQEKSVGPNPAETVAVAAKRWTRPAPEHVAQKDKEGYDWLLLKGWACKGYGNWRRN